MATINNIVATEGSEHAGALVAWRLHGDVNCDRFIEQMEQIGLPSSKLPDMPTPEQAIARALGEIQNRRRRVVPLKKRGAWAVCRLDASETDVDFGVECTVRLDQVGRPVCEPAYHPAVPEIKAEFNNALETLSTTDISGWLVSMVRAQGGLSVLAQGGLYFLPRGAGLDMWRAIAAAVGGCSEHTVYEIPAMHTQSVVNMVLDGLVDEVTKTTAAIESDLMADDNSLGARALRTRMQTCDALVERVAKFEGVLGVKLSNMQDQLVSLRAMVVAAKLTAEAAESSK